MDLKTDGRIDLAMLDPLLSAQGRRARGEVTLDAAVTGTTAAPLVQGTARTAQGRHHRLCAGRPCQRPGGDDPGVGRHHPARQLHRQGRPRHLGGSGTISLAGAMPIDLHFTADNARPLSSDLMTALIDANLTVQGEVKGDMQAGGTLHVRRADIRIPDKMPPSIAVLPVRDANAPPPPPPRPRPQSTIALNLTLDAPQQVFIRGRGPGCGTGRHHPHPRHHRQADPGRRPASAPRHAERRRHHAELHRRHDRLLRRRLADPPLHFVATSTTAAIVATLTVSGSAKDPEDHAVERARHAAGRDPGAASVQHQHLEAQPVPACGDRRRAGVDVRRDSGFDRWKACAARSAWTGCRSAATAPATRRWKPGAISPAASISAPSRARPAAARRQRCRSISPKGLKLETTAGSGSTSATGSTSSADAASVGLTYQFEY